MDLSVFEEKFPSIPNFSPCWNSDSQVEGEHCVKCGKNHTLTFELFRQILNKHCLDKEVVREVIKAYLCKYKCRKSKEIKLARKGILFELGLEDENNEDV